MAGPDVTDKPNAEEAMTGGFGAQDFDMFENNDQIQEMNEEMAKEQEELKKAYSRLFSMGNDDAETVLNDLIDKTIKRSTFNPQYENPEQMGFFLEGQNSIVAYIIQQIQEGRSGEPSNPRPNAQ